MNCIPKVDERPLPEARSGSVVEKNDQFGTSADILFDNVIFLSRRTFQRVFYWDPKEKITSLYGQKITQITQIVTSRKTILH